jgi:hypothetical protein
MFNNIEQIDPVYQLPWYPHLRQPRVHPGRQIVTNGWRRCELLFFLPVSFLFRDIDLVPKEHPFYSLF